MSVTSARPLARNHEDRNCKRDRFSTVFFGLPSTKVHGWHLHATTFPRRVKKRAHELSKDVDSSEGVRVNNFTRTQ